MPKPQEIAEVVVNGQVFRDWTTVMVDHRWTEAFHIFDFSATERMPLSKTWFQLGLKPGDAVEVRLAGHVAMTGYITHREVAYDAGSHGVRLIGRSKTWDLARSSIDTKTGSFDGYSFSAVAQSLIKPFGVQLETVGQVDQKPFKRLHVSPGENVFPFLARLAAHRKIILGSNHKGNLVAIGDHQGTSGTRLVEGDNILAANCEISDEYVFQKYYGVGQEAGDDQTWGDKANKHKLEIPGSLKRYAPKIAPVEHAGENYDVQKRTEFEAQWNQSTQINAHITVQGWLDQAGDLWRVGTYPMVASPMLMLNQPLGIKRARFAQGPRGTTTTLELVAPQHLNGRVNWSGSDAYTQPSDPAKTVN